MIGISSILPSTPPPLISPHTVHTHFTMYSPSPHLIPHTHTHTHRERERHTQRDTQRDTHTHTHTQTQTNIQTRTHKRTHYRFILLFTPPHLTSHHRFLRYRNTFKHDPSLVGRNLNLESTDTDSSRLEWTICMKVSGMKQHCGVFVIRVKIYMGSKKKGY